MEIRNYTPHPVHIYKDAEFDPSIRKYRGGTKIGTFPSVGMLSAKMAEKTVSVREDGIVLKRTEIVGCDEYPIHKLNESDTYLIVSQLYLSAAKLMGWDTSHLLTIGGAVVDEAGRTIGAAFLTMN